MGCIMIPHKTSNGLDEFVGNSVKKKKKKQEKKKVVYLNNFQIVSI